MAVESAADRAIFVSANDFGVTATIGAASVNGIFDNDFVEVDAGGGVPFAVQQPRFLARTADVSAVFLKIEPCGQVIDPTDHSVIGCFERCV